MWKPLFTPIILAKGCAHIAMNKLKFKEGLYQMSVYLYEYD